MIKRYIKKGLVFGIIFLFLGAGAVSGTTDNIKNLKIENINIIEKKEYYVIGGVNITFPVSGNATIEWWEAEDRNFTYQLENGKAIVYYYFELRTKVNSLFFIPWLIVEDCQLWHRCQGSDTFLGYNIGGKLVFCIPKPQLKSIYVESYTITPPPSECNMFDAYVFGNAIHGVYQFPHNNHFNFWATFEEV